MVTQGMEDYCAFISLWGDTMKAVFLPVLFFSLIEVIGLN